MGSCCSSEKKSGEQPMPPARHAHPTLPSTNIVRTAGGPGRTLGGSVNNDNNNINRSSGSINSRNGSVNTRSSLLYSTPGRRLSSSSNLVVGERLDARSAAALAATQREDAKKAATAKSKLLQQKKAQEQALAAQGNRPQTTTADLAWN